MEQTYSALVSHTWLMKRYLVSKKGKADVPLGFKGESHRPDKINFFHSWIVTRFVRANHASCNLANMAEELSPNLQEDHALNNLGTMVEV
jgi:hypothetical protein